VIILKLPPLTGPEGAAVVAMAVVGGATVVVLGATGAEVTAAVVVDTTAGWVAEGWAVTWG